MELSQGWASNSPWVKSGLPPVLVNKDLLEHSHTSEFTYRLLLLFHLAKWPTKPKLSKTFIRKVTDPWTIPWIIHPSLCE